MRCKNLPYSASLLQYGCSAAATAEQVKQILHAQTFWSNFLISTDCTQGSCNHNVSMAEQYISYSLYLNDQQPVRITKGLAKHT